MKHYINPTIFFMIIMITSCNVFRIPYQIEDFQKRIFNNPELLFDIKNNFPRNYNDSLMNIFLKDSLIIKKKFQFIKSHFNQNKYDLNYKFVNIEKNALKYHQKYKRIDFLKQNLQIVYILVAMNNKLNKGIEFYFLINNSNEFYLFDIGEIDNLYAYENPKY